VGGVGGLDCRFSPGAGAWNNYSRPQRRWRRAGGTGERRLSRLEPCICLEAVHAVPASAPKPAVGAEAATREKARQGAR
jgi:hypothetical protein